MNTEEEPLGGCERCGKEIKKDEEYKCANRTHSNCDKGSGTYCRECVEEFTSLATAQPYNVCLWCLGSE